MNDTVQNSQHTWAGMDSRTHGFYSMEERLFFLEEKLSTLQIEKQTNTQIGKESCKREDCVERTLADMIANRNSYITQLRSAPPSDTNANNQPVASTPHHHREQEIPDPPLFSGDRPKA